MSKNHQHKGLGKQLIRRAEEKAKSGGARITQCTIRVGNEASEQTFRRSGYRGGFLLLQYYNRQVRRCLAKGTKP